VGDSYVDLAARVTATGILSDPWLDGRPRFRADPLILPPAIDRQLRDAAETIARLHDEVAQLLWREPALVDEFLGLTPFQRLMWQSSAPAWHGLARADVFLTADGPQVCELNSDTPSGEAEAVILNQLVGANVPRGARDPNADFERRFCHMIAASVDRDGPLTVGILYPTELVEDLSMILLYRRWCEARGWRVVLGSPFNLREVRGRPALFDVPCDVFLRHYKTDWWGERHPVWLDDPPFPDAEPLAEPLAILHAAVAEGRCAVVNPFGAVVTQNKRAMALLWEKIDHFSTETQAAIRRYLPYTARLESLPRGNDRTGILGGPAAKEHLAPLADRREWVLKSDYGCEGAEVLVGTECTDAEWDAALRLAVPGRFVAQRRFVPLADQHDGEVINYGVYVIGGVAAGYFTRVHRGATRYQALTVPTFVEGDHA
jgi:hypothetical protein